MKKTVFYCKRLCYFSYCYFTDCFSSTAQFVSCDLCHEILTNLFQTIISKELFIENPKVLSA